MRLVPNIPLLWVALILVVPSTTVIVYDDGGLRGLGFLVVSGVVLVAVIDALISRKVLDLILIETPDLLRGTKGRETDLPISFVNQGRTQEGLRYGVSTSQFFRFEKDANGRVDRLESGKKVTVDFPLTPLKRGQFFLDSIHLEARSVMRFWLVRKGHDLNLEVRVYPDLSVERKRLASIFLMRGNEGSHLVRQVGKGRDFEQLREYQPGDDYVDIDWKATARRQMPVTRTYQIERTQEVYVIVDHSRLSGREIRVPLEKGKEGDWLYEESSAGGDQLITTQLEKFLHCSLILASVAEKQGDHFGFVSFSDKVDRFIRGRNGKDHYNLVRDALYTLEPEPVAPDFEQLMISLRQRLTRRALLVMLVDLSDPLTAEHFFEALPLINKQHLVLVNMVRPEKAYPMFSPRSEPDEISGVYQNLAGHLQWQELRETGNRLHHLGVELGIPEHEELCTETVTQYLNVKKRQLL
tara:strand:+ start:1360 stop:2763 length:1404 start_codon:yes stop_codon:yes gene_type:complete